MKHKILIVDDETANLRVLERLLRQECEIVCAESGSQAFELLQEHDVSLIISDQRMPGMSGIEFLKQAAALRPHTVRIILTGYTDVNALVEAINSGVVYKYVTKPWVNDDLKLTVKRALEHYETNRASNNLELQNKRLYARLKSAQDGFFHLVSEMLDFKDPYKTGHCRRTRSYAIAMGKALNFEKNELENLALAAFLHELSDFYIPNEHFFDKFSHAGETPDAIKHDFRQGLELLERVINMNELTEILRYYHENWDGSGFPHNIAGEQIPLASRIIAVVDAYDELTMRHPLNSGMSNTEALAHLQADAGRVFDPVIVDIFFHLNASPSNDAECENTHFESGAEYFQNSLLTEIQ
jgi:putative two-component system response regulator